jgi:hypothetical protein
MLSLYNDYTVNTIVDEEKYETVVPIIPLEKKKRGRPTLASMTPAQKEAREQKIKLKKENKQKATKMNISNNNSSSNNQDNTNGNGLTNIIKRGRGRPAKNKNPKNNTDTDHEKQKIKKTKINNNGDDNNRHNHDPDLTKETKETKEMRGRKAKDQYEKEKIKLEKQCMQKSKQIMNQKIKLEILGKRYDDLTHSLIVEKKNSQYTSKSTDKIQTYDKQEDGKCTKVDEYNKRINKEREKIKEEFREKDEELKQIEISLQMSQLQLTKCSNIILYNTMNKSNVENISNIAKENEARIETETEKEKDDSSLYVSSPPLLYPQSHSHNSMNMYPVIPNTYNANQSSSFNHKQDENVYAHNTQSNDYLPLPASLLNDDY